MASRGMLRIESGEVQNGVSECTGGHAIPAPGQRVAAPPPKPTEPLRLPVALVEALRKRFPENLEASAEAILRNLAEEGSFVVTPTEAKEISSVVGSEVKSGRDVLEDRDWETY